MARIALFQRFQPMGRADGKSGYGKSGSDKNDSDKSGSDKNGDDKRRTPVARRRPRLQRHSLGSVLARVLVLALGFACMVGFAVALAKVTLVPSIASENLTHTNLHPGDSIRAYLNAPAFRDAVKQIGGNILLGVPFGILLPVLIPKARGLLRVGIVTALVMLLVEAVQGLVVTGRAFDIDDVILNTTGALIGYLLLGRRLGRALHPRRKHWWQRTRREPAMETD